MASRKEYEMLFQLNAQLGGGFNSTFSNVQEQLVSMQREIQSLNKTQSDISAYQKQQSAVEATQKKLELLQQQYNNIQKEIKETENSSSSLKNKLLTKQVQIDKTTASLSDQTAKLETMGNALRNAGVDTDNLTKESAELSAKMGELKNRQNEAADAAKKFGEQSAALDGLSSVIAAAGLVTAYKEIAEEIVKCTKAAIEFESAVTGVYKTVDGSDEELALIAQGIKDMSTEIPPSTKEISSVAEAAGQLGIATEDVLDFTRVMIDLGESTNLTADEAASALAKFANITGTSADNYSRLGSVVVDLGNNFATTEADIVAMSTRLAGAGTLAGLSEAEIMALAAAMSSVGIEAEAGGTAMTQTLSAIESAVATNSAELAEFARVAGMSAEEFSSAWNSSPIEAIQSFITGLGSLDAKGESSILVLEKLGLTGIRQSNMLKSLGLAAETLGDSVATANKAWDENTALSIEASKRYATTESQLKILRNSYNNLQAAVGDAYTPALVKLSQVSSKVLSQVTEFIQSNPELIRLLTAAGIGVGAFTVALLGYIVVSKRAKAAIDALTASVKANPYLLAASAIIGVVTALGSLIALSSKTEQVTETLTATSRNQKEEIEALEKEYKALCDAGQENSERAYYLEYRINSLSDSFNASKQTVEEYIAECQQLNDAWNESLDANRAAVEEIDTNEGRTQALITRLAELASQTDKTAASQEEMKTIIAELNELLPNVSFNYEDIKNGIGEIEEALRNEAAAQKNLKKIEQSRQAMMDANKTRTEEKKRLEDIQEQYDAESEYNEKLKAIYESLKTSNYYWIHSGGRGNNPYEDRLKETEKEYNASTAALAAYQSQIDKTNDSITAAQNSYDTHLKQLVETSGVTIENVDAMTALDEAIATASLNMQSLAATYGVAYAAAKESFEGQYGLFDKAQADMSATVSSAQEALNSQLSFWNAYADDVNTLRNISAQDLGVTQENYDAIMAYAQSGTEEAAGFAKSLAEAVNSGNTEAITKLANTVGEVKAAREKAAGEVSAWQVDFSGKMKEIVQTMETSLKDMNMSEEATAAATNTMTAYANSISSQGSQAVSNALSIANQVRAELQKASGTITIKVKKVEEREIRAFEPFYKAVEQSKKGGYATGTEYATPGAHWVGENGPELLWFNGGERVLDARKSAALMREQTQAMKNISPQMADEMQIASFSPLFTAAMEMMHRQNTVSALQSGEHHYSISIAPVFHIEGGQSENTEDLLRRCSDMVVENVMDALDEAGIDAKRGAYI